MVIDVFTVHILLSKVAALVLKDLAIHWQNLGKQAYLDLLIQLVSRITINKYSFPSSMSMQVQKAKVFAFAMKVNDGFLYCVDWAVNFWRWVYIAPV